MESCDADILEIGGDEVDKKISASEEQLASKVETGTSLSLSLLNLEHCLNQTTGCTWWRERSVQPSRTMTPTT